MTGKDHVKDDIVAKADPDAPEVLEDLDMDQATGGAQYGSSNSCEPVRRRGRLDDLFITSYSSSDAPDGPDGLKSK